MASAFASAARILTSPGSETRAIVVCAMKQVT
jgi:hypothetical protein